MITTSLIALLFACSSAPPASRGAATPSLLHRAIEEPIATVDGAPVSAEDLIRHASRNRPADGKAHTPEERQRLLDEVLVDEMLFQRAMELGLHHDPKVRKILINLLLRKEVYEKVSNADFSEEELRAYYESHKEEFVVPEKVQVRRILVKIGPDADDARAKAARLYEQVKADPDSFASVALQHSDGPFKRRGGDLGFVSREGKPGVQPEVIERAFDMEIGSVAPPFEAGGAHHILMLVNRRDRVERTYEQMRGSVLRMMKQRRFEELREAYIDALRKEKDVKIDAERAAAVDLGKLPHIGPTRNPHDHASSP